MSSFVITIDVSALTLNKVYDQPFWSGTQRYISIPSGPKCKLVIHNHSGNFLQFNLQGSGRGFCIQANGLSDPVELADNDSGITYQPYAQATGYPAAWQPNMLMLVLYSPGEKPITVGNGAGFNVPAGVIGPGTVPAGVLIPAPQVLPGAFPFGSWALGATGHNSFLDIFGNVANGDCVAFHNDLDSTKTFSVGYGVASESLGRGAWFYDHSTDNPGLIFSKATPNGITFNGTVSIPSNTTGGNVEVLDFTDNAASGHRYGLFMDQDHGIHLFDFTNNRDTKLMDTNGVMNVSGDLITNGKLTAVQVVAGTPTNALVLQIIATNAQGNRVAQIVNHATAGQNADILDLARDVNSAETVTLGIDSFPSFYIYDATRADFLLQGAAPIFNSASRGPVPTMLSNGGGNAGRRIFEGTTDPGGNASEGDLWVGA